MLQQWMNIEDLWNKNVINITRKGSLRQSLTDSSSIPSWIFSTSVIVFSSFSWRFLSPKHSDLVDTSLDLLDLYSLTDLLDPKSTLTIETTTIIIGILEAVEILIPPLLNPNHLHSSPANQTFQPIQGKSNYVEAVIIIKTCQFHKIRNNNGNVDPGLLSPTSTRTAPVSVNPADWVQVVPSKLTSVPRQLATVRWPRFTPGPGDTMLTGQMKDRPSVKWSGNTGDLFTIMIIDEGIAFLNGQQYAHWLVTNVPGRMEPWRHVWV